MIKNSVKKHTPRDVRSNCDDIRKKMNMHDKSAYIPLLIYRCKPTKEEAKDE